MVRKLEEAFWGQSSTLGKLGGEGSSQKHFHEWWRRLQGESSASGRGTRT